MAYISLEPLSATMMTLDVEVHSPPLHFCDAIPQVKDTRCCASTDNITHIMDGVLNIS